MSLQSFLDRFFGRVNLEPTIATAVADDGSGDAIDPGKPSPLRADPTTGALLVSGATGGSLGSVSQGSGAVGTPWFVQGVNGGVAERLPIYAQFPTTLVGGRFDQNMGAWLGSTAPTVGQKTAANSIPVVLASDNGVATQTTLAAILARLSPGSSGPIPVTAKTVPTVTAEAVASSTVATRYVRVTSDFANTKTVYIGGSGVTVANGQPLGPGDVYTNSDVADANLIYCISADAAQVLRIEVL